MGPLTDVGVVCARINSDRHSTRVIKSTMLPEIRIFIEIKKKREWIFCGPEVPTDGGGTDWVNRRRSTHHQTTPATFALRRLTVQSHPRDVHPTLNRVRTTGHVQNDLPWNKEKGTTESLFPHRKEKRQITEMERKPRTMGNEVVTSGVEDNSSSKNSVSSITWDTREITLTDKPRTR